MSKELLHPFIENHSNENVFIGFGNPDAKVLIIGKECALKIENCDVDKVAVVENKNRWEEFLSGKKEIKDWKDVPREEMRRYFNPSKPYWKQLNKRYRRLKNKQSDNDNGGTSSTWCWYQRIFDNLLNPPTVKSKEIDFFDNCFITELSPISKAYSKDGNRSLTKQSIQERITLFREPFFQSFPIVIAACNGYVNKYHLNMRELFPNSEVIPSDQLSMFVKIDKFNNMVENVRMSLLKRNIKLR